MIESSSSVIMQHGARYHRAAVAAAVAVMVVVCPAWASAGGVGSGSSAPNVAQGVPRDASGLLRVAVEDSIVEAEILARWIEERNAGVAETIPHVEGHERWIDVAVSGTTYDYRVWVVAMRDGVPVGVVEKADACECNTEKLLELVGARIAEQAELLRGVSASEEIVPRPVTADVDVDVEQGSGPPTADVIERPSRRLQAMGYAGIGAGVLGAGLLAVGIPLSRQKDDVQGMPREYKIRSLRGPGIGLAVGGGAAFAAGLSLLVVDLVRQHKQPVAMAPMLDLRQIGVAITWRARGGRQRWRRR